MANNRMYLVHRPSKTGVYLGKHSCGGWWGAPKDLPKRLENLYKLADDSDFILVMECATGSPGATDKYTAGGIDSKGLVAFEEDEE